MRYLKVLSEGFAVAGLSSLVMAQAPTAAPLVVHQLRPNVYWVEGGGGNSTVIVGDKGVIVVDAKQTLAGGTELLADIAKITPKPVTTVLLTHSDGDHVNGLIAFPAGVKVIAHENDKKEQEIALAAGGPGAPPADHLPSEVITKSHESFKIEGETLEVYHWAPGHTSGDLVIYLPKEKIVCTGDLVTTQGADTTIHLEKNGSSEGWITNVKGIVTLDADQFVLGHGDMQNKAFVEAKLAHLEEKRAKIKEMVAQGKSLDEIRAAFGETAPPPVAPGGRAPFKSYTAVVYDELTKK